jgi:hypothetical protein
MLPYLLPIQTPLIPSPFTSMDVERTDSSVSLQLLYKHSISQLCLALSKIACEYDINLVRFK